MWRTRKRGGAWDTKSRELHHPIIEMYLYIPVVVMVLLGDINHVMLHPRLSLFFVYVEKIYHCEKH